MPPRYLYLDLPKHAIRNVSRFRLRAQTEWWNPLSGAMEVAAVTSDPVMLCKMRRMFFFTAKT